MRQGAFVWCGGAGALGAVAALTRCVTAPFSLLRNTADICRPTAGFRAFSTPLGGEVLGVINAQTLTRLTGENVYVPPDPSNHHHHHPHAANERGKKKVLSLIKSDFGEYKLRASAANEESGVCGEFIMKRLDVNIPQIKGKEGEKEIKFLLTLHTAPVFSLASFLLTSVLISIRCDL